MQLLCYQALGQDEKALASVMQNSMENSEPEEDREEYRKAFQESGLKGVWKVWADRAVERQDQEYDIAAAYSLAGDKDRAFAYMEKTYSPYDPRPFVADIRFDSLRDDPRYEQLLRKLNLPEEAIAIHLKAEY